MCKMVCLSVSASVNENAALLAFEARGRVGPSLPFPFGSVHAAKKSRRRRLTKVDLIMKPGYPSLVRTAHGLAMLME